MVRIFNKSKIFCIIKPDIDRNCSPGKKITLRKSNKDSNKMKIKTDQVYMNATRHIVSLFSLHNCYFCIE